MYGLSIIIFTHIKSIDIDTELSHFYNLDFVFIHRTDARKERSPLPRKPNKLVAFFLSFPFGFTVNLTRGRVSHTTGNFV